MSHNMSTTFVHSVKVPRLYKESAKTVKRVVVDGESFKSIVFKQNHPNVQGIYALVSEALQHSKDLQTIIEKSKILKENPCFDPWLARVLITELLWGKKVLKSDAKPIVTVLTYKEKLQQALAQNSDAAVDPCDKGKVKLPRYVRINTLLTSVDEALYTFCDDGWHLLPRCDSYSSHLEAVSNLGSEDFIQDFHIAELLVFPPGTKFYDHPGYLNGKLLLQDKASCLPAFLLNPQPDTEILDMCAAPGMKTTHLAAIINNSGKIYAVEMNEKRYKTLQEFITQTNAECVEAIKTDVLTISPEKYPNVKYILVDPSCSGSGMNRIEIQGQDEQNLHVRLRKLQSLQSMILSHALLRFSNVKKVVYSTCSIYPEENECVIDEVLQKVGDTFSLVNLKKKLSNEWHNFAASGYSYSGEKCLYALPQKDLCNGFFLAMFKRKKKKLDNDANEELEMPNAENTADDDKTKVSETITMQNSSECEESDRIDKVSRKKQKKGKSNSNEVENEKKALSAENIEQEGCNQSYKVRTKKVKTDN